jgi:signal transduction histidine kinase
MTGSFYLDWAIMGLSLANVIMLGWLGLTVLLNTERRDWGVWLAGGGLLLGAAFFVSHTAILGLSREPPGRTLEMWWQAGWLPLIALPFAWHLMVLWYIGLWQPDGSTRALTSWGRRGRLLTLIFTGLLLLCLLGLMALTRPLPTFAEAAQPRTNLHNASPLLPLLFSLYILICNGLSLEALRHPVPTNRLLRNQARRRAHPWLVAATLLFLLVSLLIAALIAWVIISINRNELPKVYGTLDEVVAWFDAALALLVGLAVFMVGQAVVAYEVFTGKSLPRGELRRHWNNAMLLALMMGLAVGLSYARNTRQIYVLLLVTVMMTTFFALMTWRAYTRRQEYLRHLRPFLGSQHLAERLFSLPNNGVESDETPTTTAGPPASAPDAAPLLELLCTDVLGVQFAYLAPTGSLAPLAGPPVSYPAQSTPPLPWLTELSAQLRSFSDICLPLDAERYNGFHWAVPLWSERGLIGILLLGPKRNEGVFTQEEIEIARATGERLMDTRASSALARTVLALQKQRLVESQILDRRTRRTLHDDILPQVHAALLALGENRTNSISDAMSLLTTVHHQISDLLREMPARGAPPVAGLGLVNALRQLMADELKNAFDRVEWQIAPAAAEQLENLAPLKVEVLFYAAREALRNAARHGRGQEPQRCLHVRILIRNGQGLVIQIEDDGVGLERTGEPRGSQQGLALHSTMLAVVGGRLDLQSEPGLSTQVTLTLS